MELPDYYLKEYYAFVQADKDYQKELVRVYGNDACNARYQLRHEDQRVVKARSDFAEAGERWRSALARMRAEA